MPEPSEERVVTILRSSGQAARASPPYPARHALLAVLAGVAVLLVALVLLFVSAWLARPRLNAYDELSRAQAAAFAEDQQVWFDSVQGAVGLILGPVFTIFALLLGMLIERVRGRR